MTRDELKRALLDEIGNIAPDVDVATLRDDDDLREALDVDSISFLNLMIALNARLRIEVPEIDYPKLRSLKSALDYLEARAARP